MPEMHALVLPNGELAASLRPEYCKCTRACATYIEIGARLQWTMPHASMCVPTSTFWVAHVQMDSQYLAPCASSRMHAHVRAAYFPCVHGIFCVHDIPCALALLFRPFIMLQFPLGMAWQQHGSSLPSRRAAPVQQHENCFCKVICPIHQPLMQTAVDQNEQSLLIWRVGPCMLTV